MALTAVASLAEDIPGVTFSVCNSRLLRCRRRRALGRSKAPHAWTRDTARGPAEAVNDRAPCRKRQRIDDQVAAEVWAASEAFCARAPCLVGSGVLATASSPSAVEQQSGWFTSPGAPAAWFIFSSSNLVLRVLRVLAACWFMLCSMLGQRVVAVCGWYSLLVVGRRRCCRRL